MGETDQIERRGPVLSAAVSVWRAITLVANAAAILILVALALPIAARLLGWEAGPLAIAVAMMPWVALASLVPVVLALIARSWTLFAVSLAVAALCVWWVAPLYVASTATGEPELRVATLSLANGGADADEVVRLARQEQVDLLALQEVTPFARQRLAEAGLDDLMEYSAVYPADVKDGTGLWSLHPIEEAESVEGFSTQTVRARVTLGSARVTVVVAHPESPGVLVHDDWEADLEALTELLRAQRGAVILAGDLNMTRDHVAFRDLEELGFADAADEAGAGFQGTFPEGFRARGPREVPDWLRRPLVAIDHVLARDTGLVAAEVETFVIARSDHRAVVATYAAP